MTTPATSSADPIPSTDLPSPASPEPSPERIAAVIHHSIYGQPGYLNPPSKEATSEDWGETHDFLKPMSAPWVLDRKIKPAEMERLTCGFIPGQMEDKWFIYATGLNPDDEQDFTLTIHFFRSWTGFKIAELTLLIFADHPDQPEGGAEVTSLKWETSKARVGRPEEAWAKEEVSKVCSWVLGVELGNTIDPPKPEEK